MPQGRESGAKANIYGRETARKIMAKLGTQPIDGNTNECYMEDRLVAVSRQQKWHRLMPLVRGDLQVFSCMQENT